MKVERVWQLATLLLAGLALAASLHTLLAAPRRAEILARKHTDLLRIRSYAGRWADEDALRASLDAAQAWHPANLDELAGRILGPGLARLDLRPAVPVADDWQVREAAVEVAEVPYADLARLLSAAAETLPAWRLREIEIRPSAEAGSGAARLVLQALEKRAPNGADFSAP